MFSGIVLCVLLASRPSPGADSTIGVTGEIYVEACKVNSGADLEIDFGTLSTPVLQLAGSFTAWVNAPKKIELDCPAGISKVTARFEGLADSASANTFRNNGTAKNVSIDLQLQDGVRIAPGAAQSVMVAGGRAEYALRARLYSETGAAEAGTISSTASFTLSYQ